MSESLKNIVIIGASGNLGPPILTAFTSNPFFKITILTRASSRSTFPPHIPIVKIPDAYPIDSLIAAFKNQDAIINMAPITSVQTHKTIITAALTAGVKRLVLSEFGTNIPELQTTSPTTIFNGKIEIREFMKSHEGKGLTWTGLVVGAFLDWGLTHSLLGLSLPTHTLTTLTPSTAPINLTLLSTTARATLSILLHPVETANRYVYINSFRATQAELFSHIRNALPDANWTVEERSAEEENQLGLEMLERGEWEGVGRAIMGACWRGGGFDFGRGGGLDNEVLGLEVGRGDLGDVVGRVVRGEQGVE